MWLGDAVENSEIDTRGVDDTRTGPTVQSTEERKHRNREPTFGANRHRECGGLLPPAHESETAGLSGGRTHMGSVGHQTDASYERDGFMRGPAVSLGGSG